MTTENNEELETTTESTVTDTSATDDTTDQTTDTSVGEGGEGDDTSQDQTTTDEYTDFTLPEDMQLDSALLESALPVFKELGLTQEQAQKLVDLQAAKAGQDEQSRLDEFEDLKNEWMEASKNDKEFGGDKFDQSIGEARLALEKLGTPELTNLLNDYGVGNHPEIIRIMSKMGALLKEDSPGNTGNASNQPLSHSDILYPTDKK